MRRWSELYQRFGVLKPAVRMMQIGQDQLLILIRVVLYTKTTLTQHHVRQYVCHTCKLPLIQLQRASGADGIFHLYEA